MSAAPEVSVDEFFADSADARAAFERIRALLAPLGPYGVRITKSQVAFRRRRGFAFLWIPGRYLAHPGAGAVLSIALGRPDGSPRFKEVVHPAPGQWLHHLEVHDPRDLDEEVARWLREAAERAGP